MKANGRGSGAIWICPDFMLPDGWTVVTSDGKLSAQFEHTVAVTKDGVRVLTLRPDEKRGA